MVGYVWFVFCKEDELPSPKFHANEIAPELLLENNIDSLAQTSLSAINVTDGVGSTVIEKVVGLP